MPVTGRAAEASTGSAGVPVPEAGSGAARTGSSLARRVPWVAVGFGAAGAVPLVVAALSKLRSGWVPQGDDAAVAWSSLSVIGSDTPLLGMPSTMGYGTSGVRSYHWGPMLFWALALPVKAAVGAPWGVLAGVLLVNLAALAVAAFFAYRRGGSGGVLAVISVVLFLGLAWGRDLFASPSNAVLPLTVLLCFLVLVWSVAVGDVWALPFLVVSGSFVVQSHILYTPVVAGLAVWALAGLGWNRLEARRAPEQARAPRLRAPVLSAIGVGLACWSFPLVYEVTHRPGNVTNVIGSGLEDPGFPLGLARALRFAAYLLGVPPRWALPAGSATEIRRGFEPLTAGSAIGAALVLAAVAALLAWSWRRDSVARAGLITSVVGLAVGAVTLSRVPVVAGPLIAVYRVRHVYVLAGFVWASLVFAGARCGAVLLATRRAVPRGGVQSTGRAERPTRVLRVAGAAVLGLALVILAAGSSSRTTPRGFMAADRSAQVVALSEQARARLPRSTPYQVVSHMKAFDGTAFGLAYDLHRRGFDIRMSRDDPYVGRFTAAPAATTLADLHVGQFAPGRRPRGEVIARTEPDRPPGAPERRRAEERELCEALRDAPLTITPEGREALRSGNVPSPLAPYLELIGARPQSDCKLARRPEVFQLAQQRLVTSRSWDALIVYAFGLPPREDPYQVVLARNP